MTKHSKYLSLPFTDEKPVKILVMMLLVVLAGFGQEPQSQIPDLKSLVGKQVTVQRVHMCQPGTYSAVRSYAGKQATVVSAKPSKISLPSQDVMEKLPQQIRATLEDQRYAATILVQFEDGTQLDTCAPVPATSIYEYFELKPGETLKTLQPAVQRSTNPPVTSAPIAPRPPVAPAVDVLSDSVTSAPIAPTPLAPAADLLSDDEVRLALSGKGRDHMVLIQDMGLMAAQGKQVPTITLFMPEAVLAIRSESAKKQFTRYEPDEDDKRRSLMIVAQGYAGETIAAGCTSITRIVLLSDSSGGVVQEAYLSEPMGETWQNNFGATNHCQSLRAEFSLADVHKVRAAAPSGEFLVAVFSGRVNTKMYKIKKKHQSKLGLQ